MTSCKYPGGCATTAIRLGYTEDSDPFMHGRLELFRARFYVLESLQGQRKALNLAWSRTVRRLRGSAEPWLKARCRRLWHRCSEIHWDRGPRPVSRQRWWKCAEGGCRTLWLCGSASEEWQA